MSPVSFASGFTQTAPTTPAGATVAVVRLDRETMATQLIRMVSVHDIGRVIDEPMARSQILGGLLQGIAEASTEEFTYDDNGCPLTLSLQQYGAPTATDFGEIEVIFDCVPSTLNPLGAKGAGEAGAVAAPAAFTNAVIDALQLKRGDEVQPPLSPSTLFAALSSKFPRFDDTPSTGGH